MNNNKQEQDELPIPRMEEHRTTNVRKRVNRMKHRRRRSDRNDEGHKNRSKHGGTEMGRRKAVHTMLHNIQIDMKYREFIETTPYHKGINSYTGLIVSITS